MKKEDSNTTGFLPYTKSLITVPTRVTEVMVTHSRNGRGADGRDTWVLEPAPALTSTTSSHYISILTLT